MQAPLGHVRSKETQRQPSVATAKNASASPAKMPEQALPTRTDTDITSLQHKSVTAPGCSKQHAQGLL